MYKRQFLAAPGRVFTREMLLSRLWGYDFFGDERVVDSHIKNLRHKLVQTCFMTPPFGFALFYVKGILPPSIKIQEVYRGVIPFIIIICIVTALCAVFPPLVTWLPSMLAS